MAADNGGTTGVSHASRVRVLGPAQGAYRGHECRAPVLVFLVVRHGGPEGVVPVAEVREHQ
jgi:hypothetical protein